MTQTYKGIEAFAEVERLIVVAAHPDDKVPGRSISVLYAEPFKQMTVW